MRSRQHTLDYISMSDVGKQMSETLKQIKIRCLRPDDVNEDYVSWFNCPLVTQFSDQQYQQTSIESQKNYVQQCMVDKNRILFGIFFNKVHIGNVLVSGLTLPHQRAEIAYVIGHKAYWGKGIATHAVARAIDKTKINYNIKKYFAGVANKNIASKKVLENNGFILEGIRRNHLKYNGEYFDQHDYGLVLQDHE